MTATGAVENADQHARDTRPGGLRGREAQLELRVAVDELLRRTSDGRYDWYETSKKTVPMPWTKPTAYSCHIVRASIA